MPRHCSGLLHAQFLDGAQHENHSEGLRQLIELALEQGPHLRAAESLVRQVGIPACHGVDFGIAVRVAHGDHILATGIATQATQTFIEHQARKPGGEHGIAAELTDRSVRGEIGLLQRVLRLRFIAQGRARQAV